MSSKARVVKKKKQNNHPPTSVMVDYALKKLAGRKGCGLMAVKNFIAQTYSLNMRYYNNNINKYVKESLENNHFTRKSGKGLVGRFKLTGSKAVSKMPRRQNLKKGKQNIERKNVSRKEASAARKDGVVKSRKILNDLN